MFHCVEVKGAVVIREIQDSKLIFLRGYNSNLLRTHILAVEEATGPTMKELNRYASLQLTGRILD